MPKTIIIASSNQGKLREFKKILNDNPNLDYEFKSIAEFLDEKFDPEETGLSFQANALLKARAAAQAVKQDAWYLADDSGIEIQAFDNRPGIYSGRFLKQPEADFLLGKSSIENVSGDYPEDHSQALNIVIENLIKERNCRFTCHLSIVDQNEKVIFETENYWNGMIANEIKGTNGFGYDPIVIPDGYEQTVAELDSELKNQLSHRAQAIKELMGFLDVNHS